ncbi:20049_t:CDS:2 [Gigaspora margarita]|uniref:20049_t:CDS:1 n=1 Tax=Gigaspora margarita TaxID=4874 RepID=A0ABN7UY82_GIGMA|nr:20049_t:CDS:2 [Gigaspora margarita]
MESSQKTNDYRICQECNKPNTFHYWCQHCNSERFHKAFNTWTSGNKHVDKFIQDAQTSAKRYTDVLEWIPYDRLIGIKFLAEGGFSIIYTAIWLDGHILGWDYEEKQWIRCTTKIKNDFKNDITINKLYDNETINIQQDSPKEIEGWEVVIKNLNDSSNIGEDFFNEWERTFSFQKSCGLGTSSTAILYGITQDPKTLDYMIVMMYVKPESLKHQLSELANNTCLAYSICEGHRPEFANGTPQKYIDLANQCMNADASKRPTATQLKEIFNVWRSSDELNYSSNELKSSKPIHSKAIYTSRHFKFSNLPDPINSIEIPHFDKERYTGWATGQSDNWKLSSVQ